MKEIITNLDEFKSKYKGNQQFVEDVERSHSMKDFNASKAMLAVLPSCLVFYLDTETYETVDCIAHTIKDPANKIDADLFSVTNDVKEEYVALVYIDRLDGGVYVKHVPRYI
jgi:hypothetical protein